MRQKSFKNIFVKSNKTLREYACKLYEEAGILVEEQENDINFVRHSSLLSDKIAIIIKEVITDHSPKELQSFQLVALHALGSGLNVILIAPPELGPKPQSLVTGF